MIENETGTAPAGAEASAPAATEEAKDPFEGFETEEYTAGEKVDTPAPDKPAGDAAAAGDAPASPAEPAVKPEEGAETPPKPGEPKKQTAQERIAEVTRARRDAERERDALRRELEELRAGRVEPPAKKEDPPAAEPADPDAPDPSKFEYGEIDPRYIAAVARHAATRVIEDARKADQRARQETEIMEQHRVARERFEEQAKVGAEKYPDYNEKVMGGAEREEWALSAEMAQLIVESDVGAEIAYHLATNPEESFRLFGLSPVQQAREFGKLETKFSAAGPAATGDAPKQDPPAKTPKAPPPVLPARGASGQFQAPASSDDFAAFEAAANGKK